MSSDRPPGRPAAPAAPAGRPPDYDRDETMAHRLDRNWAELVQELRVIGTGVQILFAFLLTIAFQNRFAATTDFQRDDYLATLLLTALATAVLITPVAIHRFLFGTRVKDEIVAVSNVLAIVGLGVLSLSMVGAVLLVADWVAGPAAGAGFAAGTGLVFGVGWFVFPQVLRLRNQDAPRP